MSFSDYQLVNLLRRIESDAGDNAIAQEVKDNVEMVESELRNTSNSFTQTVRARAQQLAQLSGAAKQYWQFVKSTRTAILLVSLLMAVVGFVAVLQTLNQADNQINIYWFLLLLLGFNAMSILLWLIFTARASFNANNGASQSPLISIFRQLLSWLSKRANRGVYFASWSETHLLGQVGQWFSSKVLHGVWIAYLLGGLIALLLALSGKQYDFVWGTTILPEQSFISTTKTLGALPSALGFDVPSTDQVLASKKGAAVSNTSPAALRANWASFLIACILLYGILPRIVLWLISAINLQRAKANYEPEWGQPYFFQLRARLLPEHNSLGVVDADQEHEQQANVGVPPQGELQQSTDVLPRGALVAGYEWGDSAIPDIAIENAIVIGAIDEKPDQAALIDRLRSNSSPLLLLVPLERVVDRGAARLLKKLASESTLHLGVVRRHAANSDSARWAAWKMTAERVKLPAERVHLISLLGESI